MTLADGNIAIRLSDLTPQWLKDNYLTGLVFVDHNNVEFPDSFFETHMQNAVVKLEKLCDISVLELTISKEEHDYYVTDYLNWGWLQLYKVPVKMVTAMRGVYPLGTSAVSYPNEWLQVNGEVGQITVVPRQGGIGAMIIGQGGDFVPIVYGGVSRLPNLWQLDYVAGMDPDNMPRIIVEAIAKLACMDILTVMSNLIRPIGVTSESASIDGLSQSQSYALPAFQAMMTQYQSDLYGPTGKNQELTMTSGLLKQIQNAYRPMTLASL
jgi:hypothetical protein